MAAFALLTLFAVLVRADGVGFIGRDWSALRPLQQTEQRAAIVHRNGIERMVIAMRFEAQDQERAIWIFPVPGTPERTKVEVVDFFPRFRGHDPRDATAERIDGAMTLLRMTQLYPLFLEGLGLTAIGEPIGRLDVLRHAEVEKWGVRAEMVTAGSVDALGGYLRGRKVIVPKEQLRTFEPYLSDQYVLILAWIASREQLRKEFPDYQEDTKLGLARWPCLFVEFPTSRAFYPLRPTQAYGSATVQVQLFVVGYVEAESGPRGYPVSAAYYQQSFFDPGQTPKQFIKGLALTSVPYTTISIDTAARNFTEDLHLSPAKPAGMRYAEFFRGPEPVRPLAGLLLPVVVLLVLAALSYLAAGLTALILLGRWKGYAKFGLWNLLTLVGLWLALRRFHGERAATLRNARIGGGRFGFVRLFTIIFVASTFTLEIALVVPLQSVGRIVLSLCWLAAYTVCVLGVRSLLPGSAKRGVAT